jgi:hypothetical protein
MEETIKEGWGSFLGWFQAMGIEPWWVAAGLGVLLLLIIILIAARKPKAKFPGLRVSMFQIAPLGRDAFLKIQNPANTVVLSQYRIIGRNDILIKNHLSGHRMDQLKEYSILLEANGTERLSPDFALELTYIDNEGKVYRQKMIPGQMKAEPPKRV